MNKTSRFVCLLLVTGLCLSCQRDPLTIHVLETTDMHGALNAGMSSTAGYIQQARDSYGENLLVLDCGDILQGTPEVFFANYIDSSETHFFSKLYNFLNYDAITLGNHDFETGKMVYDKFVKGLNMPMLCANIVKNGNRDEPIFEPYTIIRRNGYKIAILGLTTIDALEWLPESAREGISFIPIAQAADYWVKKISRKKPDVLIGLFHAGASASENRNSVGYIAQNIPGINLICAGHIHQALLESIVNPLGDTVVIMQAGYNNQHIGQAEISLTPGNTGNTTKVNVTAKIIPTNDLPPYTPLDTFVKPFIQKAETFYDVPITSIDTTIYSGDAIKGPCAWTDLLHQSYIGITELMGFTGSRAIEISIVSASSRDAVLREGAVTLRDFISIYPYENSISIVEMTHEEIADYLEYSYHQLITDPNLPIYNFDVAGGLSYTVDMSKPYGERVNLSTITANGERLFTRKPVRVVMNSYRANGGGGHLSKALNWNQTVMQGRVVATSDKSLRAMLIDYYSDRPLNPRSLNTWSFVN